MLLVRVKRISHLLIYITVLVLIIQELNCAPKKDKKDDDDDDDDEEKEKENEKKDKSKDGKDKDKAKSESPDKPHKHGKHHKGHKDDDIDYMTEKEAMKNPIFNHIVRFVSTMYDDKPDYEWITDENTGQKKPDFCCHYECPAFKVLCKNTLYEVRKYEPAKWVKTEMKWDPIAAQEQGNSDPSEAAFNRLFMYINGANDQKKMINMTVPVLVHVSKKDGGQGDGPKEGPGNQYHGMKKKVSMKFYLPKEFASNPPQPTNKDVVIKSSPEMVVYVKKFGGFVLNSLWAPKTKKFMSLLKDEYGQNLNESAGCVAATYNKPSQMMWRHNEIFLLPQDEKANPEDYCKPQQK